MNTLRSILSSLRSTGLVLGLSIAAVACADAGAEDDTGTDNAAATSTPAAKAQEVSDDGVAAAAALLHMSAMLLSDPTLAQVAPFKDWVLTRPSAVAMQSNGSKGRTFYFDGDVIVEGDIVDGTLHLVIEESWENPEWGPSYSAKLATTGAPATAQAITGADARPIAAITGLSALAIYDAANPNLAELRKFAAYDVSADKIAVTESANGDATFQLEGRLLEGGDMVVGSATLSITEKHDHANPEFNIVDYTAQATRSAF